MTATQISAYRELSNVNNSFYTELTNSLLEIEALTEAEGEIPEIAVLEEEEISPYLKDDLWEERGALTWQKLEVKGKVYYLGISKQVNIVGNYLIEFNREEMDKSIIYYNDEQDDGRSLPKKYFTFARTLERNCSLYRSRRKKEILRRKNMLKKVLTIFLFAVFSIFSFGADKLKVGVTLQPYYSFVTNIAGDKVDVFPVIRGDLYDSHNYQPQYEDLKQLGKADVVVVNGVGHDEFVFDMIKAAPNSKKIKLFIPMRGFL
ncbi:hypothetical protein HMPREF9466_01973 [Fusobacterium necrophorum subsp. funduliforme 1_1_36S]|nr:hypothetical protein HMPREF9466_01973 [Fusobacterium necrophorum subsp. funduliforme 1_1_36S]